jgi:outer membrane protein assembly factor BamD
MRFRNDPFRYIAFTALAIGLAGAAACGGRGPMLHELGPQELFERGEREFEARRWDEAIRVFERVVTVHPGHPRIEEAHFLLAESHFNKREFSTAAAEYTRLATAFPRSRWAAEARFKACESYYRLSPNVQLDQQYTKAAVEHCESMIRVFPDSEYAARAQEMLTELREKLAEKVLIGGEFYFRRRAFDSAIMYFEEVVADHAGTAAAPRALLRLVQAYDRIGYDEEARDARERLLREYPDTEAARAAREISLAER